MNRVYSCLGGGRPRLLVARLVGFEPTYLGALGHLYMAGLGYPLPPPLDRHRCLRFRKCPRDAVRLLHFLCYSRDRPRLPVARLVGIEPTGLGAIAHYNPGDSGICYPAAVRNDQCRHAATKQTHVTPFSMLFGEGPIAPPASSAHHCTARGAPVARCSASSRSILCTVPWVVHVCYFPETAQTPSGAVRPCTSARICVSRRAAPWLARSGSVRRRARR